MSIITIKYTFVMKNKLLTVVILSMFVSGCGGGGGVGGGVGDGGGGSFALVKSDDETTEYNNQYGLGNINASTMYVGGYSGSGVTVAVIDTGVDIDHPDLVNNIATGGYDYVDDDSDASPSGQGAAMSHGTHVAGIIASMKNNIGMHGIAYNAKILPLRAGNSDGALAYSSISNSIDRSITQGAKVINASFGGYSIPVSMADKWKLAHNNDIITVHAAGNSSGVNPLLSASLPFYSGYENLSSTLVAVVATDSSNNITWYSNRCGIAKNWCMAAPGDNIYSTVAVDDNNYNGNYGTMSGTSMADPHVSGAAAVLRSMWPSKTAAQIVTILYDTATDLGATGIDDIYGRGLLNLANAYTAQGVLTLYTSSGNNYALDDSSLVQSSILGDSLTHSLEIAVFDKYKRDYYFNLSNIVQDLTTFSMADELSYSDSRVSVDVEPGVRFFGDYDKDSVQFDNDYKDLTLSFAHNQNPTQVFAFNDQTTVSGVSSQYSLYSDSYLSKVNNASIVNVTRDGDIITSIGVIYGYTDFNNEHPINGMNFSTMSELNDDLSLIVQVSRLNERDTFLSNSFSGAFKTGAASTNLINLIVKNKVSDNLNLITQYSKGRTSVDTINDSVVSNLSDIETEGYSASLVKSGLGINNGTLFATFKQPLRGNTGDITLSMADGLNLDDTISFTDRNIRLSPTGTEHQLTLGYSTDYSNDTAVTVLLNRRDNPNHSATANAENAAMIKMVKRF
ncbi:Protease precursor [hydrothermal vent metagenome]|uniref:Protease n=1 Tax=hydrothermal vent metagenome TaxID=652676 RepID=A0A1W1DCF3_9ZZZZ